ncbi:DUF389 domain-containing protein [Myceligenerans indicum]|uniref:DUF389 domain-containing protein n=1 Tax=Myceligenerans indicum TaxID=2593663 RepID=A0ABS1LN31_9MICO|nr:DUF389 domain-containing protein [Myceligenerans indicum]MBL0886967.1 DUF389 domain-containing protein [Myceligenerans indicum]
MWSELRSAVIPASQRRTLEELTEELDLSAGDARANRSGFWTMLVLSGVIATEGVLSDSTATVIGAMIIAPLSRPIMGIALGLVKRRIGRSLVVTVLGSLLVVGIGALFAQFAFESFEVTTNAQITGRTSPTMYDLVAAVATGFAGAIAQARRDLSAVLPGVAIAISLAPPLAVVGVCAGVGEWTLALGALFLFLSNLIALVLTGTLVFTALGYAGESLEPTGVVTRRARLTLAVLAVLIAFPLAANTVATYHIHAWEDRVRTTADEWLADTPSARVTGVVVTLGKVNVTVRAPGGVPSGGSLLQALSGEVPAGFDVSLTTEVGKETPVGTVGGGSSGS